MNASVQSCPEPAALPVIFVPGIMGSRLRNRATGRLVWDPDNAIDFSDTLPFTEGQGSIVRQMRNGAAGKRRALVGPPGQGFSPTYLEVDRGRVGGNLDEERIRRGWGGLHQGSYQSFMSWLQHTAETPAMGQVPRGCFALHYEAWAHPYNWTDDNAESGRGLGETVAAAIADTAERYAERDIRVLKPVIITHSMGGLVSRAYTQLHGGAATVHGVIHGAMPTDGAPATYKRMLAGFEDLSRHALGANQVEVTATAGNLPGPLELLPNTRHRSVDGSRDWLRCTGRGGTRRWSKPAANPYGEIYTNRSDWWRLIYEEYLDPDGDPTGRSAFPRFLTQITKAANYHNGLGASGFHPNTRMFWSDDASQECWDHVEWRQSAAQDVPAAGQTFHNTRRGRMEWGEWYYPVAAVPMGYVPPQFLADTSYGIQEPDAPGDGTVHTGSGRYVSGPMSVATRRGFEHQHAFTPYEVRRLVAEWLFEMVQEQL